MAMVFSGDAAASMLKSPLPAFRYLYWHSAEMASITLVGIAHMAATLATVIAAVVLLPITQSKWPTIN